MIGDRGYGDYAQLMAEQRSFISVRLDLDEPPELDDFVGFFGALSGGFDRYMRGAFPDTAPDARFYVKEVRDGSIIADLFAGGLSDVINLMDGVLIVTGFSSLVGGLILGYSKGDWKLDATKAELKDLYDTVSILAKDRNGKATVETVTYEKGIFSRNVAFTFTAQQARDAAKQIDEQRLILDKTERADHERMLMYFKRSDTGAVRLGKPSGERVVIEDISPKDLGLFYSSNLAEDHIKDVIRNHPGNIYHLGFVVDVNVQTKGGKPVAYAVTHVHNVLDLPSDED